MAYVWTGVLLATDKGKYLLRVGITSAQFDKHKDLINPVIGTYTKIQASTTTFKVRVPATRCSLSQSLANTSQNVTYPGIVALADRVYEFASNSGGTVETSYYAFVFDQIRLLASEVAKPVNQQDPKLIAEYRETIKAIIDSQVKAIEALAIDARTATDDLRKFEEVSTLQETELNGNARTLKTTLENADGEIATLNNRIEENRKEIRNLQAQVRTIPVVDIYPKMNISLQYKTAMTNANIAAGFIWNLGGSVSLHNGNTVFFN
ncbi:hemeolysin protein [Salix suchowensis]|nr:hemeolysin protein [Salix suchowensis]